MAKMAPCRKCRARKSRTCARQPARGTERASDVPRVALPASKRPRWPHPHDLVIELSRGRGLLSLVESVVTDLRCTHMGF